VLAVLGAGGSGVMMLTGGIEAADGNSALVGFPVGSVAGTPARAGEPDAALLGETWPLRAAVLLEQEPAARGVVHASLEAVVADGYAVLVVSAKKDTHVRAVLRELGAVPEATLATLFSELPVRPIAAMPALAW